MGSITKLLPTKQISVFGHSIEVSTGTQTEVDKKIFIHTFEFVKLFTMKICENYFREEIHAANLLTFLLHGVESFLRS